MVTLDELASEELRFSKTCFKEVHGVQLKMTHEECVVLSWSDASNDAWAGYVVEKSGTLVAKGNWPPSDRGPEASSTLREIRAVRLMLQSLAPTIAGCRFVHWLDNQAAVSIIHAGSRHAHLQVEALEIFRLCVIDIASRCRQSGYPEKKMSAQTSCQNGSTQMIGRFLRPFLSFWMLDGAHTR